MKKLGTLAILLMCMTIINAQKRIKGNGNVVTIERNTTDYDGISVSGFFTVELVDGDEGVVSLMGEDNIINNIETKVIRGILHITSRKNKTLIPSRGQNVFITIPVEEINRINLSGTGKLFGEKTLETDHLNIQVSGVRNIDLAIDASEVSLQTSGSSTIKLKGNAVAFRAQSSGSSNVQAFGLAVAEATFEVAGSSVIETTVHKSIRSKVSGSGNVRYRGNPKKINTTATGSGSVSAN